MCACGVSNTETIARSGSFTRPGVVVLAVMPVLGFIGRLLGDTGRCKRVVAPHERVLRNNPDAGKARDNVECSRKRRAMTQFSRSPPPPKIRTIASYQLITPIRESTCARNLALYRDTLRSTRDTRRWVYPFRATLFVRGGRDKRVFPSMTAGREEKTQKTEISNRNFSFFGPFAAPGPPGGQKAHIYIYIVFIRSYLASGPVLLAFCTSIFSTAFRLPVLAATTRSWSLPMTRRRRSPV